METSFTLEDFNAVFMFPEKPPGMTQSEDVVHPQLALFANDTDYSPEIADQEDHELTEKILALRTTDGKLYASGKDAVYEAQGIKNFDAFGLSQPLLQGVYSAMHFDRPSEIQAQTLPWIIKPPYASFVAQAHNGSGKTCCFVLCILSRLDFNQHAPQALVIVPTRELAIQNANVVKKMGRFTHVTVRCTSANEAVERAGSSIKEMVVVGTMGTLLTWKRKKFLEFQHLKVLVLDEADIMIDADGFSDECLYIMLLIEKDNAKPQLLLFSATFSNGIRDLTEKLFGLFPRDPVYKTYVPDSEISLDTIAQANVQCQGFEEKMRIIQHQILPHCQQGKTIIFVKLRSSAKRLHRILTDEGWTVTSISGEMESAARDRVVQEFRTCVTTILVSTDVLSRGFDVLDVKVVINFDIPINHETHEPAYETYLHRVGRSGRFKRNGAVFNLVNVSQAESKDKKLMEMISAHFDRQIPDLDVYNDEAVQKFFQKAGLPYD